MLNPPVLFWNIETRKHIYLRHRVSSLFFHVICYVSLTTTSTVIVKEEEEKKSTRQYIRGWWSCSEIFRVLFWMVHFKMKMHLFKDWNSSTNWSASFHNLKTITNTLIQIGINYLQSTVLSQIIHHFTTLSITKLLINKSF